MIFWIIGILAAFCAGFYLGLVAAGKIVGRSLTNPRPDKLANVIRSSGPRH
jgi:hypothetical protein